MFKLLAIRPLTGCASHIYKCLRIGMMYYFCKDYVIDEKTIRRASKNIQPLADDFFLRKPTVSISAIVGMNGDGKSSLIELMMRLVNNCAVAYLLTGKSEHPLCRVEGVKAELYYLVDGVLYRMVEEESDKRPWIRKMADLKSQNKYEWEIKEEEVTNVSEHSAFFYTIVSNYSHYAYNILDYRNEREINGSEKIDNEKCRLHYDFHKNDNYQSPIILHPFRHEGNTIVNLEYDLSRHQLLSVFLNEPHPKNHPESLRRINHKDAEILSLTELPSSKLQEESIVDYFRTVQNDEKLGAVLEQIERVEKDTNNDSEYKALIDHVLPEKFETPLIEIMAQDDGFIPFVKEVINWLQTFHKASYNNSDIRKVIDRLNVLSLSHEELLHRYGRKRGFLFRINVTQLGRLDTIYRIMKFLNMDSSIAYKDYKDLTLEEKCQHYVVYKILSIITTDSHYKNLAGEGNGKYSFSEYEENRLETCINKIMSDSESHVTIEIRQIENFLKDIKEEGFYKKIWEKENGQIRIDDLQEEYQRRKIKLDELPPPVFEWTLLFRKEGTSTCDIDLNSFSSGEKQMLYSLCSIIYHLQNLNGTENTNVNLIFEEIELYFHPECQRSFIHRLLQLLREAELNHIKNLNIIFVTHSPFVLSDIPKCNVMFLQDGMTKDTMQENTFGANIHSLLKNGFFLPNLPMGEFAYQKINSLFAKLNTGDFDRKKDLEDIYQQILLVGEPFLRNQLLNMYNAYRGFLK